MCTTCGCGEGEARIEGEALHPHDHSHPHTHGDDPHWHVHADGTAHSHAPSLEVAEQAHDHDHGHSHEHGHDHAHGEGQLDYGSGPAGAHAPGMSQSRMVQIEKDILSKNDAYAARNRQQLGEKGVLALNLVSSPGSGKTTLLCRTVEALRGKVRWRWWKGTSRPVSTRTVSGPPGHRPCRSIRARAVTWTPIWWAMPWNS